MSHAILHSVKACRVCGSETLEPVIDLGAHHLSGIFVADEPSAHSLGPYPLEVVRCAAPEGCGLVQLRHSIEPEVLYADYGYRSGTNEMMRAHLREMAATIEELTELRPGDEILDIGCNDGTLLDAYSTPDLRLLGVDPSDAAAEAEKRGFDIVRDFFSLDAVRRARPDSRFRAITSIAMFYDLEEPVDFARQIAALLAGDGVWVIELSYLPHMLERNSFDTICHEHLEYYALGSIEWALHKAGLEVQRIEFNDVNGGSFRLYIGHGNGAEAPPDVNDARHREAELWLHTAEPYERFRNSVARVRADLSTLINSLVADGRSIYAYGASTKGNTILQYCGIDVRHVQKAADRNPDKWERLTPGTRIPIVSEAEARADNPDYFLVLPWHFLDGFLERERAYLDAGGKFIVPLPEVTLIAAGSDGEITMSRAPA